MVTVIFLNINICMFYHYSTRLSLPLFPMVWFSVFILRLGMYISFLVSISGSLTTTGGIFSEFLPPICLLSRSLRLVDCHVHVKVYTQFKSVSTSNAEMNVGRMIYIHVSFFFFPSSAYTDLLIILESKVYLANGILFMHGDSFYAWSN